MQPSDAAGGGPTLFLPLIIVCLLGLAIIVGTVQARKRGYLKSRASAYGICALIVLLAVFAWFYPASGPFPFS